MSLISFAVKLWDRQLGLVIAALESKQQWFMRLLMDGLDVIAEYGCCAVGEARATSSLVIGASESGTSRELLVHKLSHQCLDYFAAKLFPSRRIRRKNRAASWMKSTRCRKVLTSIAAVKMRCDEYKQ